MSALATIQPELTCEQIKHKFSLSMGFILRTLKHLNGDLLVAEELRRLGWKEKDLQLRRKGDPAKLALAGRLRKETTLSIRDIAARVGLGTSRSANARLHRWLRQPAATKGQR